MQTVVEATQRKPNGLGYNQTVTQARWHDWIDGSAVTTRCNWPGCPWKYSGTVKQGRIEHATHRETTHGGDTMHKDVKEIIDLVRAQGFKVISAGKHLKVLDKSGKPVTDADGPLIISSSPSDHRFKDLSIARLRRAGVLPGATEGKKGVERQSPSEIEAAKKAAKKEAEADAGRGRVERTKKMRERLEPLVVKIGGWDKKGTKANISRVLFATAKRIGSPIPSTPGSADMAVTQIAKGNTVSETLSAVWEAMLDEVEGFDNPAARMWELIRETQGVVPENVVFPKAVRKTTPGAAAPVEPVKEKKAPPRNTGPNEESVAYFSVTRQRLVRVLDAMGGNTATNRLKIVKNGNDLTPRGQRFPGDQSKGDVAKQLASGVQAVDAIYVGRSKTILKPMRGWWERNLKDLEGTYLHSAPTPKPEPAAAAPPPVEPPVVEPTPEPTPAPVEAAQPLPEPPVAPEPVGPTDDEIDERVAAIMKEHFESLRQEYGTPEVVPVVTGKVFTAAPTVALRALAAMISKPNYNGDASHAMEIAEEILLLEINAQ